MSNVIEYQDLIAFHPGSYVEEIIDEWNVTQADFAKRIGVSSKTISKIVSGQDNVSAATADKLAKATGISMATWLRLQAQYDTKLAEIQDAQQIADEAQVAKLLDLKYLKDNQFIENKRYSTVEKIHVLRKLFKIASLTQLRTFDSAVSYRRSTFDSEEKSIVCSNAMLNLATNLARHATDNKYSKEKLEQALPTIKIMSLDSPEHFYPKLVAVLATCGIVLEALPMLPGARLNGATKRFKNGSVLLLVTDKNRYADIFWFSLMHELGHIYYQDFHSDYEDKAAYLKKEEQADRFASEFYVPSVKFTEFVSKHEFTRQSICAFSRELNIDPGMLVGRLQKHELIDYSHFNELRTKYEMQIVG